MLQNKKFNKKNNKLKNKKFRSKNNDCSSIIYLKKISNILILKKYIIYFLH